MSTQLKAARFLFHTDVPVHVPCEISEDLIYQIVLKDGSQHTFMDVRLEDMMIDKQDTIRERKRTLSFHSGGQAYAFGSKEIESINILHRHLFVPVGSVS